jgi:hypothetical protein
LLVEPAFGDTIGTAKATTVQGPAVGVVAVAGDPMCFFTCGGSAGLLLEAEAGLSGAKFAVGAGFAERSKDKGVIGLKAAMLTTWKTSRSMPVPVRPKPGALYAGPELDIAGRWGVTLGAYKGIDVPGWLGSVGVVWTF